MFSLPRSVRQLSHGVQDVPGSGGQRGAGTRARTACGSSPPKSGRDLLPTRILIACSALGRRSALHSRLCPARIPTAARRCQPVSLGTTAHDQLPNGSSPAASGRFKSHCVSGVIVSMKKPPSGADSLTLTARIGSPPCCGRCPGRANNCPASSLPSLISTISPRARRRLRGMVSSTLAKAPGESFCAREGLEPPLLRLFSGCLLLRPLLRSLRPLAPEVALGRAAGQAIRGRSRPLRLGKPRWRIGHRRLQRGRSNGGAGRRFETRRWARGLLRELVRLALRLDGARCGSWFGGGSGARWALGSRAAPARAGRSLPLRREVAAQDGAERLWDLGRARWRPGSEAEPAPSPCGSRYPEWTAHACEHVLHEPVPGAGAGAAALPRCCRLGIRCGRGTAAAFAARCAPV